jgi:hypothetical protein
MDQVEDDVVNGNKGYCWWNDISAKTSSQRWQLGRRGTFGEAINYGLVSCTMAH